MTEDIIGSADKLSSSLSELGAPYAVGYGRPPKATQFKPGRSGNPKGRTKGQRSLASEVRELLLAKVPIVENGRRRYVPRVAAVYLALWQNAMKGNTRAIQHFLELAKDLKLDEANNVVPAWTDEMFEQLTSEQLEHFIELEEIKEVLLTGNIPSHEKTH